MECMTCFMGFAPNCVWPWIFLKTTYGEGQLVSAYTVSKDWRAHFSFCVQSLWGKASSAGTCSLSQAPWSRCAVGFAEPKVLKLDRSQGEAGNPNEGNGAGRLARGKVHSPCKGADSAGPTCSLPRGNAGPAVAELPNPVQQRSMTFQMLAHWPWDLYVQPVTSAWCYSYSSFLVS